MDYRKKHNIVAPDMINLLMQVRDHGSIQTEDDEEHKDSEDSENTKKSDGLKTSNFF